MPRFHVTLKVQLEKTITVEAASKDDFSSEVNRHLGALRAAGWTIEDEDEEIEEAGRMMDPDEEPDSEADEEDEGGEGDDDYEDPADDEGDEDEVIAVEGAPEDDEGAPEDDEGAPEDDEGSEDEDDADVEGDEEDYEDMDSGDEESPHEAPGDERGGRRRGR